MGEWRLQDSDYPSTYDYHVDRERAPHLEQATHRSRLLRTAEIIHEIKPSSVVDLGCGDGGLLSLIKDIPSWGYDFAPANAQGWAARGVRAEFKDVFNVREDVKWVELAVMTEVLEHLAEPHNTIRWVAENTTYLVASSPAFERPDGHDPDCHIWAWDFEGYEELLFPYFEIILHEIVEWSQIIVGKSGVLNVYS